MKGLIAQGMNPEEQAPAEEEQQTPQGNMEGEASDEDIEKVTIAAQEVLYDDATHSGVVKMLRDGADDPADTLARVTTHILTQLDEAAGGAIPGDAILPAAAQILPEVAELAQKAGAFESNDDVIGQAFAGMFSMMEDQGLISEEDKAEMQQILSEQEGAQPEGAPNDQLA